jgi:effector-binding domain-containing protein
MKLEIKVIEMKSESALAIREVVPNAQIGSKMGQIFGELMAYFGKNKVMMTGPPFALYHDHDDEKTDMEVGFPVAGLQKGEGRVRPCSLPGGKTVTATHVGPYERVVDTYTEMHKWIQAKGYKPKKVMWERYLNGPDTVKDPSEYITEVFWPINEG